MAGPALLHASGYRIRTRRSTDSSRAGWPGPEFREILFEIWAGLLQSRIRRNLGGAGAKFASQALSSNFIPKFGCTFSDFLEILPKPHLNFSEISGEMLLK